MQIIKLLITSLLVFSLNVNLSANQTDSSASNVDFSAIGKSENVAETSHIVVNNLEVNKFVTRLFKDSHLYIKWLKTLEESIRIQDDFKIMDDFLTANNCNLCTYKEVIYAIEALKTKHLIFWTGDYRTNLISNNGTGKKLDLIIDKHVKTRFNNIDGVSFHIDGKAVFGAIFKDRKLTWDYGTNMQFNEHKGSITFSEVILNGKYIGHQFTGTLIRKIATEEKAESFIGFASVTAFGADANTNSDDGNSGGGSGNGSSGGNSNDGSSGSGSNNGSSGSGSNGSDNGNSGNGSDNNLNYVDPVNEVMSIGFINYPTKKFGTQVWTTEDMRHFPSKVGAGFRSDLHKNGDEFKYYDWNAAMNGETAEGAQGICAPGWRVPTDQDWKTLEAFLGMTVAMQDKDGEYRGTDQGAQLLANGSSGFNAHLSGYNASDRTQSQGYGVGFISSTSVATNDIHYVSRYIGKSVNLVRYIVLKQSASSYKRWSFSEVEAMVDGTNVALNQWTRFNGSYMYINYGFIGVSRRYNSDMEKYARTSVTDGSLQTGLGFKRTNNSDRLRNDWPGGGLTVSSNGTLEIDLGEEYSLDNINIKAFSPPALNNGYLVNKNFEGEQIAVFISQHFLDPKETVTEYEENPAFQKIFYIKNADSNSSISIPMPFPRQSMFLNTPNASKMIWRGIGAKSMGSLVRCVKDSNDASISNNTPKKLMLKVGKPMTPLAFGDTVTSVSKNWSISPALDNGLAFDTATGIMSGTPLAVKGATNYLVKTVDDSQAVSPIAITVTDGSIMINSVQITGESIVNVGDSVQFNAIINPSYASNKELIWFIAGEAGKATIDKTGKLTALSSGNVMIIATTADRSATFGTFAVSIAEQEGTVEHNGEHYSKITSGKTGRVWLDRNLGTSQACTSVTDTACYGDLYQWGRGPDGHQSRGSAPTLTDTRATSITPTDGKFIINSDDWTAPGVDDSGKSRQLAWVNSNTNICPTNFSLPTLEELKAEVNDSPHAALNISNLKLPLNGLRNKAGQLQFVGTQGNYWTRDIVESSGLSKNLVVNNDDTYAFSSHARATGLGVRCIKNLSPFISPSVNSLNATVGVAIAPITFTNLGRMATQWEIIPELRAGFSFDKKTGTISGAPSEEMSAIRYRITASNAFGADTVWVRITVSPIPILTANIQIKASKVALKIGGSIRLNTIISPSNASDNGVSWSSSDVNLATVDNTGLVTAKAHGRVSIFVRANDNPTVFDAVTVTVAEYYFKGMAYNSIVSPKTGRVWLDRNLGASRVCRTSTDRDCFGDFYQFGRAADGHQIRKLHSPWNYHLGRNSIVADSKIFFVKYDDWTSADDSGELRNEAWGYGGINSICPIGFSVPREQELKDEKVDANSTVFENFLRLPKAGKRSYKSPHVSDLSLVLGVGISGFYWNRTSSGFKTRNLSFTDKKATFESAFRSMGLSVRCVQDLKYKDVKYHRAPMEVSGIKYKTIKIGAQIWTTENMRHGTNNYKHGVYSYNNQASNDILYGKYYSQSAALRGSNSFSGNQGICAAGWHIPTDNDWKILEMHLGMDRAEQGRRWAWRGTNQEGTQLKLWGGSGFDAIMAGRVEDNSDGGHSTLKDKEAFFWTSSENNSFKSLKSSLSRIYQGTLNSDAHAFSVRCIKNNPKPMKINYYQYSTVEIGNQTWTAENVDYKATSYYGLNYGLYRWEDAMNDSKTEGAQGVCAIGWHIPTNNDWKVLEAYLHMSKDERDMRWAWRGNNQGYQLKKMGYTGFNALMAGNREKEGSIHALKGKETYFWTSSRSAETPSLAIFRSLKSTSSKIYSGTDTGNYQLSVRCIKDEN